MKKLLSRRATEEDTENYDNESATNTPRWVKVSVITAFVLVLLVVIVMFASGGKHGPGRHFPSSSDIEKVAKQPWS
ncbi:hypothetical protein [Sporosarcina jiandibaonis]|uniref:hypothetical protein n=1 Tax=Sporosarcina jiandibaonis TaxID=2715535 RepID=UPI001554EF65|nr:hypothetical protein [Sporosarcina jiandibaonis]